MMKINEKHTLGRNLLERHLYSTFVLLAKTEQNKILDIQADVHRVINIIMKTSTHYTDIAVHQEIALPLTRVPLLLAIFVHDMTITKEFSLLIFVSVPS